MNPNLQHLQPYPFAKLRKLFEGTTPPADKKHISLSIGEPKHAPPDFVLEVLTKNIDHIANYPLTKGCDALREAIATWLTQRFNLQTISADSQILPVNGTREALFAFAQVVIDNSQSNAMVLMPNPFYQIYEGATYLAGATPHFYPTTKANGYLPDLDAIDEDTWQRCQLFYLCSPANPTGAVMPEGELKKLIALSDKYGFVIASDECYSELYFDTPPVGLLETCAAVGRDDYKNCVVFHSLSKRSNLPGLRSGFVAGDANIMSDFLLYRTYHGCTMSPPTQIASIAAWNDETHVATNRALYTQKFNAVLKVLSPVLDITRPEASFYLWPKVPMDDTKFARNLFNQQHVTVLPGQYLSREINNTNPGRGHVRMALVAELDDCIEAAQRIKNLIS